MKKRIYLFLFCFLFCFVSVLAPVYAAGIPKPVLNARASVVRIVVQTWDAAYSGTGFVIHKEKGVTYFATNSHVVDFENASISVWIGESEEKFARVVYNEPDLDLAIISVKKELGAEPLLINTDVSQGDAVYAIGFPAAADHISNTITHTQDDVTITDGVVSAIRSVEMVDGGEKVKLLQINASINPGNSGGPLLNQKGEVVGINTLVVLNTQGIFGSIAVSELNTVVKEETDFSLHTQEGISIPIIIACIAGGLILLTLLAFLIYNIIAKKKKTKQQSTDSEIKMPLLTYLSAMPGPLNISSIVSLMLPAAREVLNAHDDGTIIGNLSPARIMLKEASAFLANETILPQYEFMAPEQQAGALPTMQSDIYAFSGLLSFIYSYGKADFSLNPEHPFDKLLIKGLAYTPEECFASMQELIYALAPFNHGLMPEAHIPFRRMRGIPG
ncbi:MAG: trypsin-like peptidase domain-containing protein [Christensenellaceae bacterium]|jgi:hypothetical protein